MNCRPGDLAIIIGAPSVNGFIVEVVCAAPMSRFKLPDGRSHVAGVPGQWIIKLPRVLRCPTMSGFTLSSWAVISDSKLRPVTGIPLNEEQRDEVPA